MNTEDKVYRFNEIMATVELLPDNPTEDNFDPSDFILPNLTRDLAEPEIYSAILCQSLKGGTDFRLKLCATLSASAVKSIEVKANDGDKPSEDDLMAFAISANIMWASGVAGGLFMTLTKLFMLCDEHDLEMPDLATLVLRPNSGAQGFAQFDPYEILKGISLEEAMGRLSGQVE